MQAIRRVCLIGGTGFIGHHVAAFLVRDGYHVTIPTRHRESVRADLIPLPNVTVVDSNVHNEQALQSLLAGHDAVINLVGILHGSEADFEAAHVELTRKIIAAAEAEGVQRYLHMSALGADINGPSRYLRSKGRAEALVKNSQLNATIFRPSVVFGRDDKFTNTLATLTCLPLVPVVGASYQLQPVWVNDVAEAFARALKRDDLNGESLNLVGPKVYTMAELAETLATMRERIVITLPVPDFAARLMATAMTLVPKRPLSCDNLDSMQVPSIDTHGFASSLGITPSALESVAPAYICSNTSRTRLDQYRARAGR